MALAERKGFKKGMAQSPIFQLDETEQFGHGLAEAGETMWPEGTQVEVRGVGTSYFRRLLPGGLALVKVDDRLLKFPLTDLFINPQFAKRLRQGPLW